MSDLLLAYYADDLTGATDALEQLATAGVRTTLFLEKPDATMLKLAAGAQAIGIAGATRALPADALEAQLRPALATLSWLRPRHIHYKTCSTFDSSPARGSIGRALDVARDACRPRLTAVLGGSPPLGRYCAFGNLFATENVGGAGAAHRLDRHPTVSCHPATPMAESDLRRVLAAQSDARIELFDVRQWQRPHQQQREQLAQLLAEGAGAVLFDAVEDAHLAMFAALAEQYADGQSPVVSIGSSGVETGLCRHWSAAGRISAASAWQHNNGGGLLVASGSCSPVTAAQIDWAARHGFAEVALDAPALVGAGREQAVGRAAAAAAELLAVGRNVVVHLAKGPADARIAATQQRVAPSADTKGGDGVTETLGRSLGRLIDECLQAAPPARVCLAGGDTSSFAARELGIQALEMTGPASPGAPWCRACAPTRRADQVEFIFKGGQVGTEAFFGLLASGQD
ncbi:MAG: serine kinase [Planctomycetaceae bacterium]|nr:serine kinase [Planctomycetaceae bacterium]